MWWTHSSDKHFINEYSESPPVNSSIVRLVADDLGREGEGEEGREREREREKYRTVRKEGVVKW